MHFHNFFRASLLRTLAVLLLVAVLLPAPAFSLDSEDSQIFISGFNAYQRKDYETAIERMSVLLKSYPDTPLKDMVIFWLARANYKAGHQQEAAKYMAQFLRDYPDSPLKGTVDEGLLALAKSYQKGEPLDLKAKPAAPPAAGKTPAAAEPVASETAAARVAAEMAAADKAAAEAAAAAAAEKAAAEKAAAAKAAAAKAAADKAAAAKAAEAKVAAEKAAAAAARKTDAERVAAEKAAAEKAAATKAAVAKVAAEAAAERAAAEKAASQKAAAEKAAAERAATEKTAAQRAAAEKAAAEKAAAEKVAAQRAAAERAVEARIASEAAAQQTVAEGKKKTPEKTTKASMRNKAIAAYKDVIDKFPGTAAASSASAKLHQLGVEYPARQRSTATAPQGEVSQVFNLEVAQFGDLEVLIGPAPETQEVGKRFIIPIDVVNTGNGSDSFFLESGFPPEFAFYFAAASRPDTPINSTPTLAVGEKFKAVAVGAVPRGNIDGQKNSYPIKVVSAFAREVSQSKEMVLVSSAPLLRAVVKTDKAKLLPGEKVAYRISLLNIGTAAARGVTLRLNYPPQYEPVGSLAAGFKQETKAALVLDSLQLKSGESRDFTLTFQLKDEALAEQELFLRADVINNDLDKKDSFVSATSVVQRVSGVAARTTAEKLVVIPGQVIAIPLIVTNAGNVREVFAIKANVPDNTAYTFFEDVNRDGKRQPGEPIINHVGPLSPKEEAYVVLEINTPAAAKDGAVAPISVAFEPEAAAVRSAAVNLQLTYSRPILELSMAAKGGRLKPGEVSSLELNCINSGSNLAKQVTLQSIIPSQLEVVAADPMFDRADNGIYTWRFEELGAGEKRNIKVSYRVKPGIAVGTNMQLKNLLNYQDQIGNRY